MLRVLFMIVLFLSGLVAVDLFVLKDGRITGFCLFGFVMLVPYIVEALQDLRKRGKHRAKI